MKKTSLATLAAVFLAAGSMTWGTAARAQDAKAGEKKVQMCIGCHNLPGYQSSFPEIYKVPKIAGQNAKYIVASLAAYRKGERKHPSMRAIATSLSDQDMADVAAYYEQLGKGNPAPANVGEAPGDIAKLLFISPKTVSVHVSNILGKLDATGRTEAAAIARRRGLLG